MLAAFKTTQVEEGAVSTQATAILKELDTLEIFIQKQALIADLCVKEQKEYEEQCQAIEDQIAETRQKMKEAEVALAEARIVRKNKQEYDALGKKVEEFPSRPETTRKLEEVNDELERLQQRQQLLEDKLSERRQRLYELEQIISNVHQYLREDDDQLFDVSGDSEEDSKVKDDREENTPMED
ncbi:unnamed protein product, partial [Mesorhabditis belari]|uniref:THO complex subunit 7 n=1 Tax=Mesorhabditis belari TaxID=2138241 RepID=A0AAF3EQV7_9BILA